MKKHLLALAMAVACLCPGFAKADVYSFDADTSGFDNENVFTHGFNLGLVDEIESVSIELTHTVAADIDFKLLAPTGQTFVLTTDNGGGSDLSGLYTFVSNIGPQGGNGKWSYAGQDTTIAAGVYDAESWHTRDIPWASGQWTLELDDDRAGDSGSVGVVTVVYTTAVPEPGSLAVCGLIGLAWGTRRRRKLIQA